MTLVKSLWSASALTLASVLTFGADFAQAQAPAATAVAPRAAITPTPAASTGGYYYSAPATRPTTPAAGTVRGTYYGSSANIPRKRQVGGLNHDYSRGWYHSPLAKPWLTPLR